MVAVADGIMIKSILAVLWDSLAHKALSCIFSHQVLPVLLGGEVLWEGSVMVLVL